MEDNMSVDLTNKFGGHWKTSTHGWIELLILAGENGWFPDGTVMYKRSGIHPELNTIHIGGEFTLVVLDGPGDIAASFEDTIRSNELDPNWDGMDYDSNSGQIITAQDAYNLADGFALALNSSEWSNENREHIQKLISLLRAGECRIT